MSTIGPGTLKITVLSGRGLAPKDPNGKSDPYCVFGFWDEDRKPINELTHKTKYKKATLNPVWYADKDRSEITFTLKEPIGHNFKLEVWDYDHIGDPDYMGEVEFPVIKFIEKYINKFSDPLKKKPGYKGAVTGSVSFVWVYEPIDEVKKKEAPIRAKIEAQQQAQATEKIGEENEKTKKEKQKTTQDSKTSTTFSTTEATSTTSNAPPSSAPVHVTLNVSGAVDSTQLAHLRHSALLGDPKAAFELGKAYAKGSPELGVQPDDKEALKYYLIAAEAGMAIAQFKVGLFYQMGYGCESNNNRAFLWYEKAVAQNQGDALTAIAEMYESGWGVDKDINRALDYHHRAYDFGETDSLPHLGRIYKLNGEYEKAAKYLGLALETNPNDSDSLYLLGLLYENGEGVEQNIDTALHYYRKARSQEEDHTESRDALARLGVD